MSDDFPYYPGLNENDARNPQSIARIVNNMLAGSLNVTRNVIISGAGPTTIQDSRIHQRSFVNAVTVGNSPPTITILDIREGEVDIEWTGSLPSTNLRLIIIG